MTAYSYFSVTMSKTHIPARFNGEADNFYDPNFTLDVNKRMRVPKSIRVSGDYTDEDVSSMNGSAWNQGNSNEKLEMHVPDRILVVGKYFHIFFYIIILLCIYFCYLNRSGATYWYKSSAKRNYSRKCCNAT